MTRNILNKFAVKAFLKPFLARLGRRSDDRRWLARKAERWILRKFDAVWTIEAIETGWPARVRVARVIGPPVVHTMILPAWCDTGQGREWYWLNLNGPKGEGLAKDLGLLVEALLEEPDFLPPETRRRMDLPDVFGRARRWADQRRIQRNTVLVFADGCSVVRLVTRDDYVQEGRGMGNCVAGYWGDPDCGEVLSLRTPTGKPVVTLEVDNGRELWELQGRFNEPVPQRYRPHVERLVQRLDLVDANDLLWPEFHRRGRAEDDPDAGTSSWPHDIRLAA